MFLPRPSMSGLLPLVPENGQRMNKSRRSLILLAVTLLYLVAGALVFSFFEYEEDVRARHEVAEQRTQMQRKYGFTKRDFARLEHVIVQSVPFSAGRQWQFLGSLYFCTVVITTIGYGHSTPYTRAGRLFCMLYALGGIPLGLVTFQSVGERINHFIKVMLQQIMIKRRQKATEFPLSNLLCRCWSMRKMSAAAGAGKENDGGLEQQQHQQQRRREVVVKSRHLLCVSFSIGCLTIAVATGVFHQRENWSVFDAAYYCMITLSTIGFGDYVPGQSQNRYTDEPGYVLFTLFFILFGLAIFSACINLLILECMAYNADIVTARHRLKRMISVRVSTSFRIVTGQQQQQQNPESRNGKEDDANGGENIGTTIQTRMGRRADGGKKQRLSRKSGVMMEKITCAKTNKGDNNKRCCRDRYRRRARSAASIKLLREIYKRYYWSEPTHFCMRRLPTPYIEHLVNRNGSWGRYSSDDGGGGVNEKGQWTTQTVSCIKVAADDLGK